MRKLKQKFPSKEEVKKKIQELPKWGWPVIGVTMIIGIILGSTVLIWLPGTTIMSLLIGIGIVEYIQSKISKKQKKLSK